MSSLDTCRRQMSLHGKELVENAIYLASYAREKINNIHGLYCLEREIINKQGIYNFDVTKLTICCKGLGITGYKLYNMLSNDNVKLKMVDFYNVLAVCTIGDTKNP